MEQEIEQVVEIYTLIVEFFVEYSFQLLGALIVLAFGVYIARKVDRWVFALCQRKSVDITLSRFAASAARIITIVMVAIIALGKLGISVTPFLAAVGALSLGAGLALQGLLSNYSAGLNIVLTQPFVVGDTITVQGVTGLVSEVHLAHTALIDEDGVIITIPNKHIVGEVIHNSQADSMIELSVGIAYQNQPEIAIALVQKALKGIEGMSVARQPLVGIDAFGDSSIELGIRFWAKTEKLFDARYRANLAIYNAFGEGGIEIPYPQAEIKITSRDTP